MPNIFTVTLDTESLLAGNIPVGTLSLEETCEVLFSDRYFDRLYLDNNITTISFSGDYISQTEGVLSSDVDTISLFSATPGIIGVIDCRQDTSNSFDALIGFVGTFATETKTSTNFAGVIGSFGNVVLSSESLLSLGNTTIQASLAVGVSTVQAFSGFVSITGTISIGFTTISDIYGYVINESTQTGNLESTNKTICMNTKTTGVSEYTNYNFNSFFVLNNEYYGCSATGIFKLTGEYDGAGAISQAVVQTATSDFNTQKLKSARDIYAYIRSSGDMFVTVTTNEQVERGDYPIYYDNIDGIHRRRVKVAQGIKGTSWGVIVKNDSGADFTIKQVDIIPIELDRSI